MSQFDSPFPGVRVPGALTILGTQVIVSGALTDTPILVTTIPANLAAANTMMRFTVFGNTDNTAAANTFNFWIKNQAGTKVATLTFTTTAGALTVQPWTVEFLLTYRSIGAAGTFVIAGEGFSKAATFATGAFQYLVQTATTAVDTTAAHNWTIGMNWTAAVAGNILRSDHGIITLESRL